MELDLCRYFGATPTLPKIKKVTHQPVPDPEPGRGYKTQHIEMTDEMKAEKLKQVLSRLEEIKELKAKSQKLADSLKATRLAEDMKGSTSSTIANAVLEGGLAFDFSKTPDSNSFSLPAYFHRNMQVLQGNLPLTIFN